MNQWFVGEEMDTALIRYLVDKRYLLLYGPGA